MNGFNESEAYRLACGLDGKSWESKHIKTIYVNVRALLALKVQHLRISQRSPAHAPVHLTAKDNIVSNKTWQIRFSSLHPHSMFNEEKLVPLWVFFRPRNKQ